MRIGIVAIIAALTACMTLTTARAQPDCTNWNSYSFFKTAGAEDVRACLRAGADPDARAKSGATPLHRAAANGHAAAIIALLKAGADSGAKDGDYRTPFDYIGKDSPLIGTPTYWRLNDARWD